MRYLPQTRAGRDARSVPKAVLSICTKLYLLDRLFPHELTFGPLPLLARWVLHRMECPALTRRCNANGQWRKSREGDGEGGVMGTGAPYARGKAMPQATGGAGRQCSSSYILI
jgi:hypothetical protein